MTDIKQATRDIIEALNDGRRVICIHYGCENFHDVADRPVAISAIGVSALTDPTGERDSQVFSIANAAANDDAVEREKDMLQRFFEYARHQPDAYWVHWNMNNATYGFSAIIARYRFLFNEDPPRVWSADRLYDLDSIVGARYGDQFARHPKLKSLCALNGYFLNFFKDGKAEAEAFSKGEYGLCERSAAEKSLLIANIFTQFRAGTLRTANSVGTLTFADEHLDAVRVILTLGDRFLNVERELARRYGKPTRPTLKVKDEYDAQDLLRSLLAIFFEDVRAEDSTASYGGGTSRVDFVIPKFELAIELKFARKSMTSKSLGAELIVDRDRYSTHASVRHLICLVFDHQGLLQGPRGIEEDLSRTSSSDSFAVTVRIYDR